MFINQQRQKMDEKYYLSTRADLINTIQDFLGESNSDEDIEAGWIDSYSIAARYQFDLFMLDYTAGKSIDHLRIDFESVINLFNILSEKQRAYYKDPNFSTFDLELIDDYCLYIWLINPNRG